MGPAQTEGGAGAAASDTDHARRQHHGSDAGPGGPDASAAQAAACAAVYAAPRLVTGPNDVWATDFKGWFRTRDGARIDPLTISDTATRYLLRCQAVAKTDTPRVQAVFAAAFREYGLPQAMRSDNAAVCLLRCCGPVAAGHLVDQAGHPAAAHPGRSPGAERPPRAHAPHTGRALRPRRPRPSLPRPAARHGCLPRRVQPTAAAPGWACARRLRFIALRRAPFPERLPEIEYGTAMKVRR